MSVRRVIAAVVVATLVTPYAPPALAASTDLADVPMYLSGRPKPNLMMAFDDSGSMDFEVSIGGTVDGALWFHYGDGRIYGRLSSSSVDFDGTAKTGTRNINPDNLNDRTTYKKYTYLFPNGMWVDNASKMRRSYGSSGGASGAAVPPTAEFAWARSPDYNALYYNPRIRYLPWSPQNDGTTTASFTAASPSAAQHHPVFTGQTTDLAAVLSTNADEWTFRMYPGMILPAGASYRTCYRDTGDCGSWTTNASDVCLARKASGLVDNDGISLKNVAGCSNAALPVTSSSAVLDLALSTYQVSGRYPNYVEAAIPYYPATYFLRDTTLSAATAQGKGPDTASGWLRRVEIKPANAPFTKDQARTDCVATTCTYTEEIQNFANWFTYYRKRIQMMNASIGQAFTGVANLRAGFFRFNSMTNVTMFDVDAASDTANLRRMLYGLHTIKPTGGTPTRNAMQYLGLQYQRTGTGAPITSSCQFNAGFVITDGYVSAGTPAASVGNYDGQTNYANYPYNRQYSASGATLTTPYTDNSSETLADWAMKYYSENLRPDLPAGKVRFNAADIAPGADRNPNLHMNTYALGINLQGTIFGTPAQPANPYAAAINWPAVNTGISHQPSSIDELWHATLNGRGQMFSAATPEQTRNALLDVIDDVVGRDAAGAAVAVSNPVPVLGDNTIYYSEFRSGTWSGDLNGYPIDVVTGAINATSQIWTPSPQRQLAARDSGTRLIATYDGTSGVPFRWSSLSSDLRTALTPAWLIPGNSGADMVDFLRGVRSKEGTQFRSRGPRPPFAGAVPENVAVLGDIVNAEPVVVGAPNQQWTDAGYATFRAAQASRPRVVYQGANDGMVHALDAISGAERWAYVPGRVLAMRQDPTSAGAWPYLSGLTNLGQRVGFAHRFYVDGTPVASDVDLGCAGAACGGATTPNWKTLLVGGFRKGAFGYYALDVTSPAQTTEASLATNVVKWEFPNAATPASVRANVGYSYARPLVVKTAARGWVVVVSSGYNNGTDTGGSGGDGQGYLFVLNAATGALIRTIPTGIGAANDPSGLGPLSAWQENAAYDATAAYVYGGDLRGNLWRFDLTHASDPNAWSVTRLAELRDASGNTQPITDEPELSRIGVNRYVYVGTGKYLGQYDVPNGSTPGSHPSLRRYSMYGLIDDLSASTILRSNGDLTVQTATRTGSGSTSAVTLAAGTAGTRGWVIDLPSAGERVDASPQLVLGALTFTSNVPSGVDPCEPQGASYFWQINYGNGEAISGAAPVSRWVAAAVSSRPIGVQVAQGYRSYINPTDGGPVVMSVSPPSATAPGKRKSWRELTRQ